MKIRAISDISDGYLQEDGSRDSDDNVPIVNFNRANDKVKVNRYDVDNLNPTNGLRQKF